MSIQSALFQAYVRGKMGERLGFVELMNSITSDPDDTVWREIASLKREVAALRKEVEASRPHKVVAMGTREGK
jgi:hypothetical protein